MRRASPGSERKPERLIKGWAADRTASGNIPAGRRKRTGGDPITRQPSGPMSTRTPVLVGEIEVDVSGVPPSRAVAFMAIRRL
jgi:hypothetical protein